MVGKYPDAGFKTYLSYKDLVDGGEVDAVIVAVPHYFHPEIVIYALKKGLNVICEKPAGVYTKQVKEMMEVAKTAKSAFVLPEKETFEVETDGVNLQHMGICRNFTNAILGKEPLFVDDKEGINGVELMDAMLLSTWLDKKVAIPIDDELYYNELKKRIAVSRRKENVIDTVADTEDTYGSKVKR